MKADTCKHYNGTFHNKCCEAGVCYRDVTPDPGMAEGSALRIPCHSKPFPNSSPEQLAHFNRRGKCDKFELPTEAELAEQDALIEKEIKNIKLTLPLIEKIKAQHEGDDWQGVEVCPVCGGKLHMSHAAYNGHVWGRCETADCVAWME